MQQAVELSTGLSLDYREEAWGLERIVLDGISDHLPSDSHGTYAGILVKQNGMYTPLEEAKPESSIEEIIFEDNGSGYDYELLSIFHSTKRNNPFSVGRFGEGRKMIAASCLRNNIKIKYISRDWEAEPYFVEKVIDGESLQKL
ncbi:hypothetical protein HY501_03700, partial [Candidatus Woesearchaeota archaeon]|nr:hypothetical protein [Candidatus Woesearchaeota archaeon]